MKFFEENLLDHLQQPEFSSFLAVFTTRSYPKRSFVCQPDDQENLIFIVKSGRVRVFLGFDDKEFNLAILDRGDIYSTHTGTFVEALEACELMVVDVRTFRREMTGDPEVAKAMIRVLGNILKSSFGIINGLVFHDANCRLVALLVSEARRHGRPTPEGLLIELDLSVEQLARLVGASRQTVSTQLNSLIRSGLLSRQGRGSYLIPDIEGLEQRYGEGECG
ncbi:Crp/Fnr family transcriptional regulator [Desulfogranum mediterraneum]|uniref:Crp/Fnr family transcriptional regulator n=1 Tax=Desulfogranum mediterraneum TaxID=160661 RepID=UPI00042A2013|nr:Crp/Fnr family transcriptional regulator [Desulfogranum mediterraneum]